MKRRYALTFLATILSATTALAGAKLLWSYTDCNGVYASAAGNPQVTDYPLV